MLRPELIQQRLGLKFTSPRLLVEALTHPSVLNEEVGLSIASYQRLEFLGDAILGSVIAFELFQRCPSLREGELTKLRAFLVQESSLAAVAKRIDLGSHLYLGRGEEVNGGKDLPSNLSAALEALIGAVYLDQGFDAAASFVLGLMSKEIDEVQEFGAPEHPKSVLQEIVQSSGMEPPRYRVVDRGISDDEKAFTVEVVVDWQVKGTGRGKSKRDAEREAALGAIETLTRKSDIPSKRSDVSKTQSRIDSSKPLVPPASQSVSLASRISLCRSYRAAAMLPIAWFFRSVERAPRVFPILRAVFPCKRSKNN